MALDKRCGINILRSTDQVAPHWPSTTRFSTDGGRSLIGSAFLIWPFRFMLACLDRWTCPPLGVVA